MSFWKNAGKALITKDFQDEPVVHKGRAANILRVVLKALDDVKDMPNGAIVVDFGNTEASGHVQQNYPKIKLDASPA